MKKQGLGILNTKFVTQGSDLLVLGLIHKKFQGRVSRRQGQFWFWSLKGKKQDSQADPAASKTKGIESIEELQVILSELYVSMAGSAMDVLQLSHRVYGFFRDMGNELTE